MLKWSSKDSEEKVTLIALGGLMFSVGLVVAACLTRKRG